jgi:hypothetical protein
MRVQPRRYSFSPAHPSDNSAVPHLATNYICGVSGRETRNLKLITRISKSKIQILLKDIQVKNMPNAEVNGTAANPPYKFKVIIIGAGLGGCATAMAMHLQGFDVVIYEKIRKFQRLGDSLGLGENALKLLKRWGIVAQMWHC